MRIESVQVDFNVIARGETCFSLNIVSDLSFKNGLSVNSISKYVTKKIHSLKQVAISSIGISVVVMKSNILLPSWNILP